MGDTMNSVVCCAGILFSISLVIALVLAAARCGVGDGSDYGCEGAYDYDYGEAYDV